MLFTGSGRHRRQSQAEKTAERAIAAAGAAGVGIALPLLAVTSAHAAPSAVWDRVAECESGGNWSADAGDGLYGGLQINAQRWVDYGGTQYAALPNGATRSQQIAVAERILATEGPQPWSGCADSANLSVATAPGVVDDNDSADQTGSLRGARGVAAANAAPDGTVTKPSAAPVFSGLPGYDPVYHVYWYQKNGGWFWTSHQSLYERYVQLTNPQPPAATPAPGTTAPSTTVPDGHATPTAPVTPVTPVVPVVPVVPLPSTDPSATPSPSTPAGDQNGNPNGNGNGNNGNTQPPTPSAPATTTPSPTAPATDPTSAAPSPGRADTAPTAPAASAETPAAAPSAATTAPQPYTVGPGDTLAKIARTHELDGGWAELYKDNQQVVGENPDLIHPGQVLNLG
ncbi:transglycosylase family protein [Kitasatospora sp. NPDC059646]|uniref:transglycosylase family protein n=1 Tax=Kitasatospora sp. NPDC059646 TaxID=3346893 RepID=UPI0036CF5B87